MSTELERMVEVEQRSKSNTHRIDALEASYEALRKIASSIEVLAVKMANVSEKVDVLDSKVSAVENVPAKRWNAVVDRVSIGVVSALAAALMALLIK